ncbi:methylated-DNA-[protein]-cysteine S-methyltransferase [Azospirillum lipoferum]|uniref:Methylated-DNA--protein-cysteine methyltransferase n=1 Tax=Azospirillum lipoferum TaxID=193 RepID=A0A5A9GS32_AZOLI|nr:MULTISPECIES: methylated-DNA--[protein]-cysteine S-methyltransferase [Azospirillum]KAA0596595.1 methylated-DNA--[protein]-cysteine S-methyltransferase [Azospirillum lipoferum]MCP1610604.1 methylated-DNA-[protein]-cysteine S-methyltransferase [Azospirillum lipoferum]MDW5537953.1 methylated-DNA--[protein]-cysteine S-methyltransferase [Azospirillum sp. NL1]
MSAVSSLLIDRTATPIGELIVVADGEGALRAIDWTDHEDRLHRLLRLHHSGGYELRPSRDPGGLTRAMDAYFAGDLAVIDRLPVRTGGTPFQRAVWAALRGIPCGTTIAYRELAALAGRPAAVRAAGHANGANPLSVVVPCHRVIGSGGALTGYGGGVERKRWLLAHEGVTVG